MPLYRVEHKKAFLDHLKHQFNHVDIWQNQYNIVKLKKKITFHSKQTVLVNLDGHFCESQKTKNNRDLKMSKGFRKALLLLVELSTFITICHWIRACPMPLRQHTTFIGIFFLLYPETDLPADLTLC